MTSVIIEPVEYVVTLSEDQPVEVIIQAPQPGAQGPQGPAGPIGPPGATGSADPGDLVLIFDNHLI